MLDSIIYVDSIITVVLAKFTKTAKHALNFKAHLDKRAFEKVGK